MTIVGRKLSRVDHFFLLGDYRLTLLKLRFARVALDVAIRFLIAIALIVFLAGCAPATVDYSKPDCCAGSHAEAPPLDPDWWRAKPKTNFSRWSELSEVTPTNTPVCADGFQKK